MATSPSDLRTAKQSITSRKTGELCLTTDVNVNGLDLNTVDDFGVTWVLADMEGWWTTPESDIPDIDRGWADGSYETRGRYTARVITITGSFFVQHAADVKPARDRLIRAVTLTHSGGWLLVRENDFVKGSRIFASGAPQISTVNVGGRTDFSIGLRMPDPLKYSIKGGKPPGFETLTLTSASDIARGRVYDRVHDWSYPGSGLGPPNTIVTNFGNFESSPILTVVGPTYGNTYISNQATNQMMTVLKTLGAAERLTINCVSRQVSLNGALNKRSYLDLMTDWISIIPGDNMIYFQDIAGSVARLEVQWRSSWIG